MKSPLKITFRDMPSSKAIEDNIREKAHKLDSLYDDIMSCRVTIEAPHRHHHKGNAYVVRVDIFVPGGELVVNREPKRLAAEHGHEEERDKHAAHEDVYVAIRDAFNAAARKLQDYTRRRRGEIKTHKSKPARPLRKLSPLREPLIAKKK